MAAWKQYQEETATYFRSLGLEASTDVTIHGVRTTHDIDVLVKSYHAGFEIMWVVECKHWSKPVNKLHVLALREIVHDTGADRGILLSESGFQSGAIEAANLTNVQVTSLKGIQESTSAAIYSMRFLELIDRVGTCKDRYWSIPKEERIRTGLRFEYAEHNYSGARVVEMCEDLLTRSIQGAFPFRAETLEAIKRFGPNKTFASPAEVLSIVDEYISDLEKKLDHYDQDS